MSVAPKGKEATFAAMGTVPLFLSKLSVGLLSGYPLNTYMPEGDRQNWNPNMIWFIIGILTFSTPMLLTVFEK